MPRTDRQPIVELEIGGTKVPADDFLVEFDLSKKVGIWTGTITLFDPEWTNIEALALEKGFGTEVRFKYGWEDALTDWIVGRIKGIRPNFSGDGVGVEIDWMFGSASSARTVRNITYDEKMRISDIVKQIADRNGWDYSSEPGSIEDTVGTFDVPFIQDNVSDKYFIENILAPRAINVGGVGGYHLSFVGNRIYFKTFFSRNRNIYKTYIVQRGVDGEVINFSPSDNVAKIAQMGGNKIKVVTFDPVNKTVNTSSEDITNNSNLVNDGGWISKVVPDKDRTEDLRKIVKPFRRKQDGDIYAKTRMAEFAQWMYQVDAEILGDPFIPVMGYLRFILITAINTVHYLSGVYQVYEVNEKIQGSYFGTSVVLRRTSVPKGDTTIQAVAQSLVTTPANTGIVGIIPRQE